MTEENTFVSNKALLDKEHSNMWKYSSKMAMTMALMPEYEGKQDLYDSIKTLEMFLMIQREKYGIIIDKSS